MSRSQATALRAPTFSRRRRFLLFIHGLTAAAHALPALALSRWLAPAAALLGAVLLFVLTTWRFRSIALDSKRPRFHTLLLDEPLFCHWAAGLFGLLLFPVALIGGLFAGLLGHSFSVPGVALFSYGLALPIAIWSAYVSRRRILVRSVRVAIPGLPAAFSGYRIVQLSDLHVGSFTPRGEAMGWVAKANALGADLAVVTGDLVTSGTSFYEDAADVVGTLRAPDGVFVVLGNHDQWDAPRFVEALQTRGPTVLRNACHAIVRGKDKLLIAGLGDRSTRGDDLEQTLAGRPAGAPTVLLAHYPESFEAAAARGVELVLSGHTHGGQLGLPFIADRANLATLGRKRSRGLVRHGQSQLYVNAGLGTTGPPMRLGVLPEIAVLVLETA